MKRGGPCRGIPVRSAFPPTFVHENRTADLVTVLEKTTGFVGSSPSFLHPATRHRCDRNQQNATTSFLRFRIVLCYYCRDIATGTTTCTRVGHRWDGTKVYEES